MAGTAAAERLVPLLMELARGLRARQMYAPDQPELVAAMERLGGVSRTAPEAASLAVLEDGFALDNSVLQAPGLDDLAAELRARGVDEIVLCGELAGRDAVGFVECLVRQPERPLDRALADAGVEGMRVNGPRLAAAGVAAAAAAAEHQLVGRARSIELESDDGPAAELGRSQLDHAVELVQLLGELESCDDVGTYNLISNKIEVRVDGLVRSSRAIDAYRAVLVYCRHATDKDVRPSTIVTEAGERLRRVVNSEPMVEYVVCQACDSPGLSSVQATQVLISSGPTAVRHLLARYAAGGGSPGQTQSILIALGEQVLPALIDEMHSGDNERARRAARLMGEMQNPAGVNALVDALVLADSGVQREVAKALARIASPVAIQALVDAVENRAPAAEIAAACLGNSPTQTTVEALKRAVDERSGHSDRTRREAIRSLGRIASPQALSCLRRVLDKRSLFGRKQNRGLRVAAAQAIGHIGGSEAYAALAPHAKSGDAPVRHACREAIAQLEK